MKNTALVLGATGATGKSILTHINGFFSSVKTVSRKPSDFNNLILDELSKLGEHSEFLSDVTHVFCCLGTTIAKAGSKAEFERIDKDLVLACAKAIKKHSPSLTYFGIVTSRGSNPGSRFLYLRTKGTLENELAVKDLFF